MNHVKFAEDAAIAWARIGIGRRTVSISPDISGNFKKIYWASRLSRTKQQKHVTIEYLLPKGHSRERHASLPIRVMQAHVVSSCRCLLCGLVLISGNGDDISQTCSLALAYQTSNEV